MYALFRFGFLLLLWLLIGWAASVIWNEVFVALFPPLPIITWWQMLGIFAFTVLVRMGVVLVRVSVRSE